MTMYQRLQSHATLWPNKIAIHSETEALTYEGLFHGINLCINYYQSTGLKQGDRVAVLALNHADWFVALFAAAHCGVVLVPLNWRLSENELGFVLNDCAPALLLHDSEFENTAKQLSNNNKGMPLQLIGDGLFPPTLNTNNTDAENAKDLAEQPLLIVYTSGTTGRPKGAVLNQKALLCSADMSVHMYELTEADRVFNVLPLFHVGGLNIQPLPALLSGATLYQHARFNANEAVKALAEHEITLINTVPTVLLAMLNDPACSQSKLASLRAISIGSTDVPISIIHQVQELDIPLIQVYGATETSPVAIYQRVEDAHVVGSIGRCGSLCEVRLINEAGKEVAVGESGEIQVKGDNVLSHYWNNTEATHTSLVNGWFSTGDVAHQDVDGYYWFDDRLKHVIISGGENIYPAELERVIRELPGVEAVSVVGQADDRWGEVPVVVLVGAVEEQVVKDACAQLARFKQPRKIIYKDELPRNALGKVQVQVLKNLLSG